MTTNTICIWFDNAAEEAANFYAATFPDSTVKACTAPRPIILLERRAMC